jgi:hypothetical protein
MYEPRDLSQHPLKTLDLVDLTSAVPYFIPTTATIGVLASHPPDPDLQQRLRLPFQRVLVIFGADLELDPHTHRWPSDYPHRQLPHHAIARQLIDRGGYVSGMVLLADQAGGLRDDLLWIVAADHDPTLPWPASLTASAACSAAGKAPPPWPHWCPTSPPRSPAAPGNRPPPRCRCRIPTAGSGARP